MTRVLIGRVNKWLVVPPILFGGSAVVFAAVGEHGTAVLLAATALLGLVPAAPSLRWQTAFHVGGGLLAAGALRIGAGQDQKPLIAASAVLCGATALLLPRLRRRGGEGGLRTEELVGRTVLNAERLLGYPTRRQPDGLQPPLLVLIPDGGAPSNFDDPEVRGALVVTAVVIDPIATTITFGVAAPDAVPGIERYTREDMQAELVARVGGFPGVLRPPVVGSVASATPR